MARILRIFISKYQERGRKIGLLQGREINTGMKKRGHVESSFIRNSLKGWVNWIAWFVDTAESSSALISTGFGEFSSGRSKND